MEVESESSAFVTRANEPANEPASSPEDTTTRQPVCCIVIGMAGSGKTTLMHRLSTHLRENKIGTYCVNLDPACLGECPFSANIDIKDSISYKQVMKEYQLGPNGAIMTSLNLFVTQFDQVISLLEKRSAELEYILLDTPGQIEVFTWSASGLIVTEAMGSTFPTVIVYVVDTPRCLSNPASFMANMLYACSVLYKSRLPLLLCFNKIDVASHIPVVSWMSDHEAFLSALATEAGYTADLMRSMSLVLEEFYNSLRLVGVSCLTGEGMEEFLKMLSLSVKEYNTEYKPYLLALKEQKKQRDASALRRMEEEAKSSKGGKLVLELKGPTQPDLSELHLH